MPDYVGARVNVNNGSNSAYMSACFCPGHASDGCWHVPLAQEDEVFKQGSKWALANTRAGEGASLSHTHRLHHYVFLNQFKVK